jgi:hypothetical protein
VVEPDAAALAVISNVSDRYCLGCGYALQGLGRYRCPECGRPFNPQDPLTTAAHPTWDSRIALAKTSKILTVWLGIAAGAAFVASATGVDPLLLFLAAFILFPFIVVLLIAVLRPSVPLSPRRRAAGIACAALLISIVVTDWPFRVVFELHRPALNRIVARVRSGQLSTSAGPVSVGLFQFRGLRMATNGNLGLQLTGGAGGGTFLVYSPQQSTWIWYNTNWEQKLRGGWFRVYED